MNSSRTALCLTLLAGTTMGLVSSAARAADDALPTAETVEAFAFANQMPIPSLPANQWIWLSRAFPLFGGIYVFGDTTLVGFAKSLEGENILWNPLTGIGRSMTTAQATALFHVAGAIYKSNYHSPTLLSDGSKIVEGVTPGNTFHCHPRLGVKYSVIDKRGNNVGDYMFVEPDPHPRRLIYNVCSEGNLPDHETASLDLDAAGMGFVPLSDGTILAVNFGTSFGASGQCVLRLDSTFRQRGYVKGCPVQIDERQVHSDFIGANGGSPSFRVNVVRPIYEAAVKALQQMTSGVRDVPK